MNFMNFLEAAQNVTNQGGTQVSLGVCSGDTLFVFQVARLVIRIIQVAVPFALIIWGSLDFFKAVIAGDEKEMKQKRKPFVQRLIAAVIILLLPSLVNLIINSFASDTQFGKCWSDAKEGARGSFTLPDSEKMDLDGDDQN